MTRPTLSSRAASAPPLPRHDPALVGIGGCEYEVSDLVTVAVAAALLGESVENTRKRVAAGELPAVKTGTPPSDPARDRRRIRVPRSAVLALLTPVAR